MSSTEAKAIESQQRLLPEISYHLLVSAGISLSAVRGSVMSLYVGNLVAEYTPAIDHDSELNAKFRGPLNSGVCFLGKYGATRSWDTNYGNKSEIRAQIGTP
ncbi:hypothetical protein DL763_003384 [Monosporascus cannonballus]|nr:hypothetical protein DL763_003384 [Monosporascus cannonballus]